MKIVCLIGLLCSFAALASPLPSPHQSQAFDLQEIQMQENLMKAQYAMIVHLRPLRAGQDAQQDKKYLDQLSRMEAILHPSPSPSPSGH